MMQTIVFLHGGGLSSWMWRPQVEAMSGAWHCLAPDLPGHGELRDAHFEFDRAVDHIADLVRRDARGGKAHIVGLSLGGQLALAQLALAMLARVPDVALRVVVSGTSVRPLFGRSLLLPVARWSLALNRVDAFVRSNFRTLHVPEAFFPDFARDARSQPSDSFAAMLRASLSFRLPPGLERATAPTLVLVGEHEPRVVHRSAHDVTRALRAAEHRVIPGAHHLWNLEHPAEFTRVVEAWLRIH